MHTVTTDAHSVAPPPISALISTTLMNVGFLAIFRVYTLFSSTSILPFMNNVLILSGTLSLTGCCRIYAESKASEADAGIFKP